MVKVDMGSMSAQSTSVSSSVSSRVTALNQGVMALNDFLGADNLQGNAYSSAKQYAASVLTPLLQASILYSECVSEKTSSLERLYASYCSESLDSEELEAQIRQYESSMRSALNTYRILSRDPDSDPALRNSVLGTINTMQPQVNQLREKLRKLYQFNTASARSFESISSLETTLMSGLNQVKQSFSNYNPATGFVPPKDMTWVETVNSQWKKREEVVKAYHVAVNKVKNGQDLTDADVVAIAAYVKKYPNIELPEQVKSAYPINEFIENYGVSALAGLGVDELTGKLYYKYIGETVEEGIINRGVNFALQNAGYIYANRYSITNSVGKIIGKIPGATHEAIVRESAESVAKYSVKAGVVNAVLGEAISFGPGVLVGAGINMASGDTAEEAWGKEIVTGATTAVITPIATVGVTTVLTGIGVIATGASLPAAAVVGVGIAVGIGVNMVNDWLREEFPEVKEFEDNVGEAVVDGWNNLCNTASDTLSFINPFD
mgnify:FL=1|jgi:hypothetical protein